MLDTSKEGMLTVEEIKAGLRRVVGDVQAQQRLYRDIMTKLDSNRNNKVDYTEFLTAASNKAELFNAENLRFAFNSIDLSKDGQISKDELKKRFSQC